MKKLGFTVLLIALCAMLSGCWGGVGMDNNTADPTFGTAPEVTSDPFMNNTNSTDNTGSNAAEPFTGEAGDITSSGVDPSATDQPLSDTGSTGM